MSPNSALEKHSSPMDDRGPRHSGSTLESRGELSEDPPPPDGPNGNGRAPPQPRRARTAKGETLCEVIGHSPFTLFEFHSSGVVSHFSSFLPVPFTDLSSRRILFSLFCSLSPNLDNSDQVTWQMKDLRLCLL